MNPDAPAVEPAPRPSWAESNLPTFLRWGRNLPAASPRATAVLLAILGLVGVLTLVVLASFAVHITSRP